jgi:hypothetical protein
MVDSLYLAAVSLTSRRTSDEESVSLAAASWQAMAWHASSYRPSSLPPSLAAVSNIFKKTLFAY